MEVDNGRSIVMQMTVATAEPEAISFDKERLIKTVWPGVEIAAGEYRVIEIRIVHTKVSFFQSRIDDEYQTSCR